MRSTIVIVIALLLVVYGLAQVGTTYRAKNDLQRYIERALDFVDETTKDEVRTNLIAEAHKLGITVLPEKADIVYEDADVPPPSTPLTNKRVVISLRYAATVCGLPVHQQITASKFRQVAVPPQTTQVPLDSR